MNAEANEKLLHELFVSHKTNATVHELFFSRLQLPRSQRNYVQTAGARSLASALDAHGVRTNLTFFRICESGDDEEECPYDPLEDPERIEKALSARWARKCINVRLGEDEFSVLSSKVDTYYVVIDMNDTKLVEERSLASTTVELDTKVRVRVNTPK